MNHQSAYERITERILDLLASGVCPWHRPWNKLNIRPANFATNRAYSGINQLLLDSMGFEVPLFLTFHQVKELGGQIIKGSKGFPVVYWGTVEALQINEDEETKAKKIPFLKYFTVFNASQIEGITFPTPSPSNAVFEPIAEAEAIVTGWANSPNTQHGRARACYNQHSDEIHLPSRESFLTPADYYATRFHEMGHATGHPSRLNRKLSTNYGGADYSKEELIAEMTSAFLCAHCGLDNSTIENQTAYLQGWMQALKGDSKLVVTAASQAQRATNLILGKAKETEVAA